MSELVPIEQSAQWSALAAHYQQIKHCEISTLFDQNPQRFDQFSCQAPNLFFDYSKNLVTQSTLEHFTALGLKAGLPEAIQAMFAGDYINNTEERPALHVALRSPNQDTEYEKQVHQALNKMESFANSVLTGQWKGFNQQPITDVVNIGIGGSDLGPAMVYEALSPFHEKAIQCHFVSNVDPCHLAQTLEKLNPATTLFVIASKSFNTLETSQNANAARHWLLNACHNDESALPRHFVAVSANIEKAQAFGIKAENIFPLWDWVGGRYSLWSAIGLPLILGLGMINFKALLQGAHEMDEHFRSAPLEQNMPFIMAILNLWYLNFFKAQSQVILPYYQNLHLLPAFLQQLDMESLGKTVRRDGSPVAAITGGIIWGSAGTNGQHSFHQLLHQGSHLIPADFIAVAQSPCKDSQEQQQHLLANCLAQSQALMQGHPASTIKSELMESGMSEQKATELAQHKAVIGNRPSSTIMIQKLNPESLGSLIACYEHKVFSLSVLLQINAFDQWGVQLGKELGETLFDHIASPKNQKSPEINQSNALDSSTQGLINLIKNQP